jgi:hypothetical protein
MPDESDLPIVSAADADTGTTPIRLSNAKDAAFMLPMKESIDGFTCHAFTKMRKGFIVATGNELCNDYKYIAAYKAAHPDWRTELTTQDIKDMLAAELAEASKIEEPTKKAEAINAANNSFEGNLGWAVMCMAIPDFHFHLTALAYLCCGSAAEIARLIGKSREYFNEKVFAWAEAISDDTLDRLQLRAYLELLASNIGQDYKVKEEKGGAPANPN